MASLVEIANAALLRVGDKSITSLTEDTERARIINAAWPIVRSEVLRAHPWNVATARASLAALATAPEWDYATAYELPPDCEILLEVNTTAPWRREGKQIVTDATGSLGIRYIKGLTDTEQYDGFLTELMVIRLTIEIVERVTTSGTSRERLIAEYERKMGQAQQADGAESSEAEFEEDIWMTVRL